MIITIDTAADLSDQDKSLLALLAGSTHVPVEQYEANRLATDPRVGFPTPDPEKLKEYEEKQAEEKPAPRRRAAAKKAAEPVAEEAPEEPADETPEAVEDDTPAVLEEEPAAAEEEFTLADAVAVASPLISAGKGAAIKKILTAHGVKRVGELPAAKIGSFIADLKKLEAESGE